MKKLLFVCMAFLSGVISADAYSTQGEYWEVTTKMEMKGMPFAMPATTVKVCIPPGEERDPRRMRDKNSNCEFSDVKTSGNKVSYKGKCEDKRNGTMYMDGENTYEHDSSYGTMHMTGKSEGRPMDMAMSYKSKRIGGSCDADEMAKKVQAMEKEIKGAKEKMCDTSDYNASQWVSSAHMFISKNPACPGKKEALCDAVRREAPRDAAVFHSLQGGSNRDMIAQACGLNMAATTKAICKTLNGNNFPTLVSYCPAEAKAYRELARKREDCAGRGYTAGEKMKECMGGRMPEGEAASRDYTSDSSSINEGLPGSGRGGNANPAGAILDGAKKLKGLFGF